MKILHILNDGPCAMAAVIMSEQRTDNDVRVIDLSEKNISCTDIVDAIFSSDRVTSW